MAEHARRGRPLLETGETLTAAHLSGQQEAVRQRLRRHLRLLHGAGVVCGLAVVPAGEADRPWAVTVCPGYAIGPHGDEIVLPRALTIDLAEHLWTAPVAHPKQAYVAVRYAESERMATAAGADGCGCGCREPTEQVARIRDCCAVAVLWEKPPAAPAEPDLCRGPEPRCARCVEDAHVPLACIDLPAEEARLTRDHIHRGDCGRRG